MRAAILQDNGPIDTISVGEIEAPKMRPDEMMVRVHAAAINPADLKVVTGSQGAGFIHAKKFPMTFGYDFSGVVERVGADVRARSEGDAVFGHLAYSPTTRLGSFAEFVVVKPERVGVKPANVSHADAAASATVGCTALQALRDKGRLRSGQRALINGASGGVGSYAVQVARLLGAEVWGTASATKADFVRSLGATEVVDYRSTPLGAIGQTFDVLLDAACTSSFGETQHLLNREGAYVTLLPSARFFTGMLKSLFTSKRCAILTVQSRAKDLDQLGAWLGAGKLDASVEKTFPFADLGRALVTLESGAVQGKLAVAISA